MFTTGIKEPSTVTAVTVSYFILRSRRYKCNWSVSGILARLYILQETMSRPGSAATHAHGVSSGAGGISEFFRGI